MPIDLVNKLLQTNRKNNLSLRFIISLKELIKSQKSIRVRNLN